MLDYATIRVLAEQERAKLLRESESNAEANGIRVLVVDDQPDERELLFTILAAHGAEVNVAGSVEEAMDKLEHWQPAVLVTDISMPGEDGYALLRKVREMPGPVRHVPAIAVTAHARAEDRAQAFNAGFHAYIPKPVDHARLVQAVKDLGMATLRT